MCKQTSRILHIFDAPDTLALLLFICPWIRHILQYLVKPLTMNYLKVHFLGLNVHIPAARWCGG